MYPLALFGIRKFGNTDKVLLQPIICYQHYDVIVTDLSDKAASQSYIEITQSHEGENQYLRSIVLHIEGSVFPLGKVSKTDTKRTGMQVSVEREAVDVEKAAEDDLKNILIAAKKKVGKNYPADTSLIIFFDDSLHFPRPIADAQLGDFVNNNIFNLDLRFSSLYLVALIISLESLTWFREPKIHH